MRLGISSSDLQGGRPKDSVEEDGNIETGMSGQTPDSPGFKTCLEQHQCAANSLHCIDMQGSVAKLLHRILEVVPLLQCCYLANVLLQ